MSCAFADLTKAFNAAIRPLFFGTSPASLHVYHCFLQFLMNFMTLMTVVGGHVYDPFCQCRRQTQVNLTTCHLQPAIAAGYAATTRSLIYHMSTTSESLFNMPSMWTTELPLAIEQIQISLTDFMHNPKLPLMVIFLRSKVLPNDRADGL